MKISLVEDEEKIADFILSGFQSAGFSTQVLADDQRGLVAALSTDYDAIVLDVIRAGINCLDFVRTLRRTSRISPATLLTAKSDAEDRLSGFVAGADDYLPKPFYIEKLIARLKTLSTKSRGQTRSIINQDKFQPKLSHRHATWIGYQAALSPRKFSLIEYLFQIPANIFCRPQILKHVWEVDFDTKINVIDVCIQCVRKELNDPRNTSTVELPIEAIRDVGCGFKELSTCLVRLMARRADEDSTGGTARRCNAASSLARKAMSND